MKTIKVNNQEIKIEWNATAFYLFGKNGGNIEEIAPPKATQNGACSFANIVILLWAMLDAESRVKYPSPESLAGILLPLPNAQTMALISEVLVDGNKAMAL